MKPGQASILMAAWEKSRVDGRTIEVAELCREHPELTVEIEQKVEAILKVERFLGSLVLDHDNAEDCNPEFDWIRPGDILSGCRVIRRLGDGGSSGVFLAEHPETRLIALKVFHRPTREARMMSNLDHPAIVRVYHSSFDEAHSLHLIHMEYFPCASLDDVLDEMDALGVRDQRSFNSVLDSIGDEYGTNEHRPRAACHRDWYCIVAQFGSRLADAIHYAHQQSVVHRDIKPANILVAADGSPKLIDFNISYDSSDSSTSASEHFGGSIPYMSPEQLDVFEGRSKPDAVSSPTDIFSLCKSLLQMLAPEIAEKELDQPYEIEIPLQGNETAPVEMIALLQDGLNPNPESRPTAEELARQLFFFSEPSTAKLIYPRYPAWTRRNRIRGRAVYMLAALLLCVLPNLLIVALFVLHARLFYEPDPRWSKPAAYVEEVVFSTTVPVAFAAIAALYFWPCSRFIAEENRSSNPPPGKEDALHVLRRVLFGIPLISFVVVAGWGFAGIAFPIVNNQFGGTLTATDRWSFFLFSLAHGTASIAWSLLVATCFLIRFLLPGILRRAVSLPLSPALKSVRAVIAFNQLFFVVWAFFCFSVYLFSRRTDFDIRDTAYLMAAGIVCVVNVVAIHYTMPWIKSQLKVMETATQPLNSALFSQSSRQ